MTGTDLPSDSIAILDSSVLFAMGGPSNEKYQAFEQYVTQRDIIVRIPDQVAEELGESPAGYMYQRNRLRAAQDAGWLERGQIDFSNPGVSDAVDRTRKRMANLSAEDVTEDEIEKTDTVLAGVAYQYATDTAIPVTVLVSDRIAEQAIGDVLSAMELDTTISVVEGRTILKVLSQIDWNEQMKQRKSIHNWKNSLSPCDQHNTALPRDATVSTQKNSRSIDQVTYVRITDQPSFHNILRSDENSSPGNTGLSSRPSPGSNDVVQPRNHIDADERDKSRLDHPRDSPTDCGCKVQMPLLHHFHTTLIDTHRSQDSKEEHAETRNDSSSPRQRQCIKP